jgi:hypothetical protein
MTVGRPTRWLATSAPGPAHIGAETALLKPGRLCTACVHRSIGAARHGARVGRRTALSEAAWNGHLPVVKLVVEAGAAVSFANKSGCG